MRSPFPELLIVAAAVALVVGSGTAKAGVPSDNPKSGDATAIETGRILYLTHCYSCHGQRLNGRTRFPAGDLTIFKRGFATFLIIVQYGKKGSLGRMPGWRKIISEEDITNLGAYIETYAKPEAKWTND